MYSATRRTFVAGALAVVTAACSAPDEQDAPRVATVEAALEAALAFDDDTARVIVNLRPAPKGASFAERRAHHRRLQDEVIEAYGSGFTPLRRFEHVPALAGTVTKATLERMRSDPNVTYIQLDGAGRGQAAESPAAIALGDDKVKSMYGITGRGVTVAVLDTGVVTDHPDLKSSIVAQHCFTQYDCPPSHTAEGASAEDDHGHGSNVAGIITSDGVVAPPGFAPDADIVAVKIDDENDAGQISDWVAGLDWVYSNLSMLKVRVMNLSICSTSLYSDAASCDAGQPALAAAVKNLVDAGVVIFSASGNQGSTSQTSAPACNTGVIAVGATYDADVGHQPPGASTYAARWGSEFANCADATTMFDQITCFTNSNKRVDLVAPGAPMLSDSLNNGTETYWGTSQASPVGAGVAALLLQCDPGLSPADIESAMTATGVPRMDPKNGLTFPSLRALDVVRSVCFKSDAGAGQGGTAGAAGSTAGVGAGGGGVGGATMGSAGTTSGGAAGSSSGAGGTLVGAGGFAAGGFTAAGGVTSSVGGVSGAMGAGTPFGGAAAAGFAGQGGGVMAEADGSASAGCNCTVPRSPSDSEAGRFVGLSVALGALLRRRKRRA